MATGIVEFYRLSNDTYPVEFQLCLQLLAAHGLQCIWENCGDIHVQGSKLHSLDTISTIHISTCTDTCIVSAKLN